MTENESCPVCYSSKCVKDGHNTKGTQKYKCKGCGKNFSGTECNHRKKNQLKELAIQMFVKGESRSKIAQELNVCYRTVERWLNGK
jgi:transposase-like protein